MMYNCMIQKLILFYVANAKNNIAFSVELPLALSFLMEIYSIMNIVVNFKFLKKTQIF